MSELTNQEKLTNLLDEVALMANSSVKNCIYVYDSINYTVVLECPETGIKYTLTKFKSSNKRMSDITRTLFFKVAELWSSGISAKEMGKILGVHYVSVNRYVRTIRAILTSNKVNLSGLPIATVTSVMATTLRVKYTYNEETKTLHRITN